MNAKDSSQTNLQQLDTTGAKILRGELKSCSRCIYDETIPAIHFDEEGVCNYCRMIEQLEEEYKTGTPEGEQTFFEIVEKIKKAGKNKKYDCVIGVSGGTDSSYMVHKAVEWGLRPLAVHYDNTWNTAIATENIRKVLGKLNIDLYTHVVDNKEADDIFRSFFRANVPDLDCPTDIALAEVLYRAANKYGVKYILEGHSFKTEGVSPLSNSYIDGQYVKTVQKLYGSHKIKTFPNMDFNAFMKWTIFKRIRKIRPLWYIKYSKEEARAMLEKEYGWEYYGGHHLENRMTAIHHSFYNPRKFQVDQRNNSLSAAVRLGIKTRQEALEEYAKYPTIEPELVDYFKKRLNIPEEEFNAIMNGDKKSYKDYKTYKKRFEKLRPLFYILAQSSLVPKSFYIKYCSKSEI
ncbi:LPS biosynthesis protein [marine bacterium AO1-C]|nr:LPS biosynthesis protein [marine bacterium AO1-C]